MRRNLLAAACVALTTLVVAGVAAQGVSLTPNEQLGKDIFFDETLSLNANQSCATCHGPQAGWTGPDTAINAHGAVYEGSIPGAFGDRKPPSSAYATQSPILLWIARGGNFWDGRGKAKLTQQERRGWALFRGKGKCAKCHVANGQKPLFTYYTFDNLGKHKVPTMRNVDKRPSGLVKAYGHNGYFKTLDGIVHFYNTRDVKDTCPGAYTEAQALAAGCWPAPEVLPPFELAVRKRCRRVRGADDGTHAPPAARA